MWKRQVKRMSGAFTPRPNLCVDGAFFRLDVAWCARGNPAKAWFHNQPVACKSGRLRYPEFRSSGSPPASGVAACASRTAFRNGLGLTSNRHFLLRPTVFREGAENCARGGRAPVSTSEFVLDRTQASSAGGEPRISDIFTEEAESFRPATFQRPRLARRSGGSRGLENDRSASCDRSRAGAESWRADRGREPCPSWR